MGIKLWKWLRRDTFHGVKRAMSPDFLIGGGKGMGVGGQGEGGGPGKMVNIPLLLAGVDVY